jgi:hypothetical protein
VPAVRKMDPTGHLVWILVFDDQLDHLDSHYLLMSLDIDQMVQKWTWT